MKMTDEMLIEAIEQAETPEEQHQAIVALLKSRPRLKEMMLEIMMMDDAEAEQTISLYTEAMKPHTVSS